MTDPQKRLAIFISNMHGGGAQRAMLKLAQGMAGRGCVVDQVLARAEGPFLSDKPPGPPPQSWKHFELESVVV